MSAPLRLQTQVWNPLGRATALLLHAEGSDGGCWWRLASRLADAGWLVVAPDLRSHGRSPTAHDHRLAVLAADVALLGESYDLVVADSLGGAVAAQLLTIPGFSQASVLLDPLLRLRDEEREPFRRRLTAEVGELDVVELRARRPGWSERDLQRKILAARMVTPDVVDALLDDNDPWDVTDRAADWSGRVHLLVADPERGGRLPPETLDDLVDGDRITGEIAVGAQYPIYHDRPNVVAGLIDQVAADVMR